MGGFAPTCAWLGKCWRSKPLAPICYPPAYAENWNCCTQRPPNRQREIGSQPQDHESDPENLSLHWLRLGWFLFQHSAAHTAIAVELRFESDGLPPPTRLRRCRS